MEYTNLVNLKGMSVENAIRYYLDLFTMPGEA